MNTYAITIIRYGEDEQTEIVDRWLTADQAIDLLIQLNELPSDDTEPTENKTEDELEIVNDPKPQKRKTTGKKKSSCGICGGTGHNKKTCPKAEQVDVQPEPKRGQNVGNNSEPWYFTEVLALLEKGMTRQEILDDVGMTMTLAQFQQAYEWAKSQ